MIKYYVDAAIWRDLHENRVDKFRPLGDWAFELFRKIRINKDIVLYSDLIIDELSIVYNEETIKKIFEIVSKDKLIQKVKISDKQAKEAGKIKRNLEVPFGDALHAILARDNNAIMVTRDKHFFKLSNIAKIKKPEELI